MKITGRITELFRMRNSAEGNPRYRVTIQSDVGCYTLTTKPKAQIGFLIGNSEFHEGPVEFTVVNHEITHAEPVS